jgi:DNA-binding transcriptional MerR regulator/effector-binding domain-containing protein
LPRLNSILALKELGLTLEQIAPLLENGISPPELRAMLTMKRAQLEQSLREEEGRLRHIESRIAQIDRQGSIGDYDVVVKQVAPTPFLACRCVCETMEEAVQVVRSVALDGARHIRTGLRDKLIVVVRNDLDGEKLDIEVGFSLTRASNANLRVTGGLMLTCGELPAVDMMATIVRAGTNAESHCSFGMIGMWIEAHACEIAGPCREVFLEPVTDPLKLQEALVEIQFPVRAAA